MIIISYSILFIFIPIVLTSNSCKQHKTCNECIRDTSVCSWCSMDNFNGTNRCTSGRDNLDSWCSAEHIINPQHKITTSEDLNFNSEIGKVIQIKPQKIDIDIRPGETVNFSFSFKKADNYPVDLYFLFDGSSSMEEIKNKTASKSEDIYRMMQNMTNNVFLGMGTFVDKNALPYTQFKNSTLTYSFRNRLKLTDNFEIFKNIVKGSTFGSNYDVQEGTLDALAQVIVCKDEIGWRNESRKIIIVLTDQSYHATGDGKWAGIFQPYDGKCYTVNGIYTKELEMDYPSVGIINKLAAEDEIRIIFAVGNDVQNIYESLSQRISGSKMTTYKGREMAVILKSIYKQMIRNLKLKVHMKSDQRDDLQISFNPDCYKHSENHNCRVMGSEEKKITGTIKLLRFFDTDNINIDVVFEGIKENLKININVLNSCDCETKHNSSLCNYGGTRRCGICECYQDRYGDKCSNPNDNSTCIAPDDSVICSGHGSCIRGKCLCRDGYERDYCECVRDSCLKDTNDILCSYPNGKCDCGVCKCSPGWVGDVCACPNATDCTDGNNICNNRGICECGACQCQDIADWDARTVISKYCKLTCGEKSCHERQCLNLEPLALCYLQKSYCKSYENVIITTEKNLTAYNESDDWYQCPKLRIDVGCYTRFIYRYSKDKYELELKIQSEFDYAETYYVIGGTCLALLILIGLATIIAWKYITDKRDRREYERFVKEATAQLSPCDNPIYEPATTTFHNPAFRKRSFIS
ncbi:integrin beta-PS-like [Vanessa tameamea]|uniref:Integrin beta n=1 Tax=Vanessa tameamea TaxID=334116 RepID=A0A8B8HRY3_VANTA